MKKILVSRCLYLNDMAGYEGQNRQMQDPRFQKWKEEGRLFPACPEALGGPEIIGVDAERSGDKVLGRDGSDLTAEYQKGAEKLVKKAEKEQVLCAILRETSPFCASHEIYDGSFSQQLVPGKGMAAEQLEAHGIRVFSEHQLDEVEQLISQEEL